MNFSKVLIGGRLTRDPENKTLPNGTVVAEFRLIWDSGWGDKKKPVAVDVTMFGKRAEAFVKFHGKGDTAFVEGELRMDQWEDKQTNAKRSKLYMVANEWQFVGGKSTRSDNATVAAEGGDDLVAVDGIGEDIPF